MQVSTLFAALHFLWDLQDLRTSAPLQLQGVRKFWQSFAKILTNVGQTFPRLIEFCMMLVRCWTIFRCLTSMMHDTLHFYLHILSYFYKCTLKILISRPGRVFMWLSAASNAPGRLGLAVQLAGCSGRCSSRRRSRSSRRSPRATNRRATGAAARWKLKQKLKNAFLKIKWF